MAISKFLGACLVLIGAQGQDVKQAFEQFMKDFNKDYKTEAQKSAHFRAFAENYEYITRENAKGHSYKLGINEMSDMTADEIAMSRGGILGSKVNWGGLPSLGMHKPSGVAPPASMDWREKNAVTPVKNQQQCGSCWAFSTTGSLEGAWAIATGKLVSFSEQQLVDCSKSFGNNGCGGGLMDNGFKYEETVPVCTEETYPYTAQNGICKAASCTAGIPKGGVTGFKDVAKDDTNALIDAVALGPVSVAIEADQAAFQNYKSGVLTAACGTTLDHGVLIVGYGAQDGKDYWLVKNSWGASWGEQGYIKLERGLAGAGQCGIKSDASYPVVQGSGPAPGPSPPTPAPATSHYEAPPCQADETAADIQGAGGQVCAPSCDTSACPTDKPAGTWARPECILQDASSGKKYCGLACIFGGCPQGAKCARLQGPLGVCVYPSQAKTGVELQLHVFGGANIINV